MTASTAQRKRVAPYAPASSLSEFFDHIRYVKTPERVDSGLLEDYGILHSQTFALLSTLRFLGIVDADGSVTAAFRSLQTGGEEFKEALKEIVLRAYDELFDRLDVSRDGRDKITNYFARNYSPATASKATALFLDICGEAGIETAASPRGERQEGQEARASHRPSRKPEARRQIQTPTEPPANAPRAVLELRLTEDDLQIMDEDAIKSVFEAAGKIEVARTLARNKAARAQEPTPADQEAYGKDEAVEA